MRKRVDRLRAMVLVLVVIVVFAAFAAPLAVIVYQQRASEASAVKITCVSARANISQLTALREISDQLGVPVTFTIPEVPAECDGF